MPPMAKKQAVLLYSVIMAIGNNSGATSIDARTFFNEDANRFAGDWNEITIEKLVYELMD